MANNNQYEVWYDESDGTYKDTINTPFVRVSHVLDQFFPKFDPDGRILRASAAKRGISPEALKGEWLGKAKDACDHGNVIHDALEDLGRKNILPQDEKLRKMALSVYSIFKDYGRAYSEVVLYSKKYRVAGRTDKLCSVSTKSDSVVDIFDYKTNKSKGIQYFDPYGKWCDSPIEHLSACNYTKYSLQQSLYGLMFEEMTGRKVRKLGIIFIPPNDFLSWQLIPVPYMKHEAIAIMEAHLLGKSFPQIDMVQPSDYSLLK